MQGIEQIFFLIKTCPVTSSWRFRLFVIIGYFLTDKL